MKSKIFHLILMLFVCIGFQSIAQPAYVQKEEENGTITFARFSTDSDAQPLSKAVEVLRAMHRMREADEWRQSGSVRDEDRVDCAHQYYQQYYKGVRVAYGNYSVHAERGHIETVLGNYHPVGGVDVKPRLSESEALRFALKYTGAEVYKWEIPEEERWVKETFNESYVPKGEPVIVKDYLKTNRVYRLAYKFDIYAHRPLSRNYLYVDAITGEILDKDTRIHEANATGTAATRYSGSRSITTDSYSGGYRLREAHTVNISISGVIVATYNTNINTYNMNRTGTYSQTDFTDNNNNWTAAEYHNTNMDDAALDAHWGAEMTYNYFAHVHNRNSWNGSGGALTSYVHANLIALGYSNNFNAFWDGNKMTYGDGNASPLTTLDICAHEIGHGITDKTANLKYEKESGAIDEALSDMWAACVENWAAPNKQTWVIGEDLGLSFRSMSNPNSFGQPDTYLGTFWFNVNNCTPDSTNDRCGVHRNSGVANFWFYLLSQGGSGTNDNGNAYQVSGIGITKAARIIYKTITAYINSSSEQTISFAQFRNATISAATNLYGANSAEVIAATNAWYAVGLGNAFPPFISGSELVPCSGTVTYSVASFPGSISWSIAGGNLQIVSGQGTSSITVSRTSGTAQSGVIRATFNYQGTNITLSKTVSIGARYITVLHAGGTGGPTGTSISFTANPIFPASEGDYQWMVSPTTGVSQSVYRHTNYITFSQSGTYTVGVRSTSGCTSPGSYTTVSVSIGGYRSAAYAVGRMVAVSFEPGAVTTADQTAGYTLSNMITGVSVAIGRLPASGATLDFGHLPAGIYILRIETGVDTFETHKVVLNK